MVKQLLGDLLAAKRFVLTSSQCLLGPLHPAINVYQGCGVRCGDLKLGRHLGRPAAIDGFGIGNQGSTLAEQSGRHYLERRVEILDFELIESQDQTNARRN